MQKKWPSLKNYERRVGKGHLVSTYGFCVSVLLLVTSSWLNYQEILPYGIHFFIAFTSLFFIVFVAHECTHMTAGPSPRLNTIIGRLAGIIMCCPYGLFSKAHIDHHRHVYTKKDPDWWGYSGKYSSLFKLCFINVSYFRLYKQGSTSHKAEALALILLWSVTLLTFPAIFFLLVIPGNTVGFVFSLKFIHLPHKGYSTERPGLISTIIKHHNDHHNHPSLSLWSWNRFKQLHSAEEVANPSAGSMDVKMSRLPIS